MKSVEKEFLNHSATIYLEVEPEDQDLRLDEACKKYLKSQSRESIKRMISARQITLINRNTKSCSHTRLRHMDIIQIKRTNLRERKPLKVIFEDDFLVAISKPKMMPVHPTGIHHFNTVSTLLERDLGIKLFPVHRLDIKTSGVLILAKTKEVASLMQKIFELKEIQKKYYFESYKEPNYKEVPTLIEDKISRDYKSNISLKQKICDQGKESSTKIEVISDEFVILKGYAWPITGRTHQIRCHLSYYGLPIIGDHIYGHSDVKDNLKLHCIQVALIHPITKRKLLIKDSI